MFRRENNRRIRNPPCSSSTRALFPTRTHADWLAEGTIPLEVGQTNPRWMREIRASPTSPDSSPTAQGVVGELQVLPKDDSAVPPSLPPPRWLPASRIGGGGSLLSA